MSTSTRRRFLATAGLTTAGGVAALAVAEPASATPAEDISLPDGGPATMAAYVHDVTAGEVALMVEGREIIVTDHVLTARLAHAFARATRATRS